MAYQNVVYIPLAMHSKTISKPQQNIVQNDKHY